ncbi:MAG TPA: AI-2E family transporter [Acidobacteriaceae bacterium]|nr:AI-2E family transporter [Acidobacteriaceae bacterium]
MLSKFWDPKVARVLFTALVFILGIAFLYGARETITLFVFATLFAYFVEPMVLLLQRPLHGRIPAIAAVYLLLVALLIGLGFVAGPRIAREGKSLVQSLPLLLDRMGSGQLVSQVGNRRGWSGATQAQIQGFLVSHRDQILGYAKMLGAKLAEPARHIWWLVLIPILSLFFLKDGRAMAKDIVEVGRNSEERWTLRGIVGDIDVMLGSYIRAQLILASLTFLAYTTALSLMKVPYAFLLGPLAGIFEFVPVVGPALAALTVFVIAILSSYSHILGLFIFLACWRIVQDYFNAPRIMGKSLEVSPVVQIFGVLAGAEIAGVVGALISVPLIATLRIFWRRINVSGNPDMPITPPPAVGKETH